MSNPPREEVERWMKSNEYAVRDGVCSGVTAERIDKLLCFARRALDMRDAIIAAQKKCIFDDSFIRAIERAVEKFDGGGDEPEHDLNAEWGGGRTR